MSGMAILFFLSSEPLVVFDAIPGAISVGEGH